MQLFRQTIEIIGVNPYVEVPEKIVQQLLEQMGKDKGPIPVSGMINGKPFIQKVIKYQGMWLMYLNTEMRDISQVEVGDTITVAIELLPAPSPTAPNNSIRCQNSD